MYSRIDSVSDSDFDKSISKEALRLEHHPNWALYTDGDDGISLMHYHIPIRGDRKLGSWSWWYVHCSDWGLGTTTMLHCQGCGEDVPDVVFGYYRLVVELGVADECV